MRRSVLLYQIYCLVQQIERAVWTLLVACKSLSQSIPRCWRKIVESLVIFKIPNSFRLRSNHAGLIQQSFFFGRFEFKIFWRQESLIREFALTAYALLDISWHLWNLWVYVIERVIYFALERFLDISFWFQIRRSNRYLVELYEVFCHFCLFLLRHKRILRYGLKRNLWLNLLNSPVILREFITQILGFWDIFHHTKWWDKGLRFGLMRICYKILLFLLLISDNFLCRTFHWLPWSSLIRTILSQIRVWKRRI